VADIILFGPPGCGKGTQAQRLTRYDHVSTGEVFRQAVAIRSELGKRIEGILGLGTLIPDDITLKVVEEQCMMKLRSIVWDGFPRTVPQAKAFDHMCERYGRKVGQIINLKVPENLLFERVLSRFERSGRPDDNPETFEVRLKTYHTQSVPVLEYYSGRVITLDGTDSPNDIADQIKRLVR
jgi:adenylate kinase